MIIRSGEIHLSVIYGITVVETSMRYNDEILSLHIKDIVLSRGAKFEDIKMMIFSTRETLDVLLLDNLITINNVDDVETNDDNYVLIETSKGGIFLTGVDKREPFKFDD